MVQIADIVVLKESVDLGVDPGDTATFRGIHAEWKGNAWQITALDDNAPQGLRRGQSVPRQYTGGLVNTVRQAKGLERLRFDGGGNVVQSPNSQTTPRTTPTSAPAAEKPPVETDDLSRGQRRQLSRHGRVTIAGHAYTRQEITDFTDAARIRRAQLARDATAGLINLTDGDADDLRRQARINKDLLRGPNALRYVKSLVPLPLWGSPGVTVASWMALKENMIEVNDAILQAPSNKQTELRQMYQERLNTLIGVWILGYAVPDFVWTLKNSRRTARIMWQGAKTALRTANAVSMLAQQAGSVLTGPGFALMAVKNLLQWLFFEASLGVATYFIMRSETVITFILWVARQTIIEKIGGFGYTQAENLRDMISNGWDAAVGNALEHDPDTERRELAQLIDEYMPSVTDIPGVDGSRREIRSPDLIVDPVTGEPDNIPNVDTSPNAPRNVPKAEEVF
jgi:hypothetical protein